MAQKATAKSSLPKSNMRLLLNAEPFGFGPTAAIAGFFPHLRPHFNHIGYIGKKHTLDLQRGLPYDAIHDMSGIGKDERDDAMRPVMRQYDAILTAMDYKVAEIAKEEGLKVFYYDALAWYWPEIPESVQQCDLYLAQDFFGVKDRLKNVFARHAAAHVVPPIVEAAKKADKKDYVLINLGGLQNPFWPVDDVVDYARCVIKGVKGALPAGEKIVIAGSEAVVARLKDHDVVTFPREKMLDVLAGAKCAFMTPGLGNIYDAAANDLPTIWLPPANDSQGQQLDLIAAGKMMDGAIGWGDVVPGTVIDYKGEQQGVLNKIAVTAGALAKDDAAKARFTAAAAREYTRVIAAPRGACADILTRFGRGGEERVAQLVLGACRG